MNQPAGWSCRSLPQYPDKPNLEFSGMLAMRGDSDNEAITIYRDPDRLDPQEIARRLPWLEHTGSTNPASRRGGKALLVGDGR